MKLIHAATMALILTASGVAAQEYSFKFQSSDPAGNPNYEFQKGWTELVAERSDGKIQIEMLPVGSVVEYNETLDAVAAGILDGQICDSSYWAGKDPAFGLISNPVGAWSDPEQMIDFVENGGGKEIMQELLGSYGLHFIGVSTPGLEAFVSRVPLEGVDDLKGVKVRTPEGPIANVFAAAGASPVNLPSSEVYTSLDKGVVDAADYSVFSVNQQQGLNETAPHPVYPGFHSLPLVEVSMNKAKWDALPDDMKTLLEDTVKEFQQTQLQGNRDADEKALAEAEADPNITVHNWSDEERAKFRKLGTEEWQKIAGQSPMAQQVYDTLIAYLNDKGMLE
ncbi:TRAP transporter substrate-binding protein [Paracoccus sp. R12_1]|uniref:TRAP transporter substrate-binding protein n=1 Tax=unclassified Paracoccus (in: a-proteobacteria) TaxID=2688777 RepID=UPI001ADC4D04|nr:MULTISPECIES: TRAP transporter substrate-binding protein [unclassified Paracoccus (in: a-proteobacteria)]MBO9455791.1 TRAP transporter substrate-binding protein [Paracoccus sp. R12_2]MBO9487223.1 TRAP transporter substrate-binding protein [Paracoccus sp. R12_1]